MLASSIGRSCGRLVHSGRAGDDGGHDRRSSRRGGHFGGTLYAWGSNVSGELGIGNNTGPQLCESPPTYACGMSPVAVSLPSGVSALSTTSGYYDAFAVGSDGNAYAWGAGTDGDLGNGATSGITSTPAKVPLPTGVTATAVAAGEFDAMASGSDGHLYAWGVNDAGQLGDGTTTGSSTPVKVLLPTGVTPTAIADSQQDGYAIGSDGHLYAWGDNLAGELGDGSTTGPQTCGGFPCSTSPVQVALPTGVTATALAGGSPPLVLGSNGLIYQLEGSVSVVSLPAGVTATALAGGELHDLAIGSDGHVYAWGDNSSGELGNGTITNSSSPVAISLGTGVTPTAISATMYDSFAIGSDDHLYSWGDNADGQLGVETTPARNPATRRCRAP